MFPPSSKTLYSLHSPSLLLLLHLHLCLLVFVFHPCPCFSIFPLHVTSLDNLTQSQRLTSILTLMVLELTESSGPLLSRSFHRTGVLGSQSSGWISFLIPRKAVWMWTSDLSLSLLIYTMGRITQWISGCCSKQERSKCCKVTGT